MNRVGVLEGVPVGETDGSPVGGADGAGDFVGDTLGTCVGLGDCDGNLVPNCVGVIVRSSSSTFFTRPALGRKRLSIAEMYMSSSSASQGVPS